MSPKMLVVLLGIAFVGSALSSPALKYAPLLGGYNSRVRVPEHLLKDLMALLPMTETETVPKSGLLDDAGPECECGIKAVNRIVGGVESVEHEWPWQALVVNDESEMCGGAVISKNWVVTAAHCTSKAKKVGIFLGLHKILDFKSAKHITRASLILNHENYVDNPNDKQLNDIALLKLRTPIPEFNNYIQPICLPYSFTDMDFGGEYATVTGWGDTQEGGPTSLILRQLSTPVLNSETCANKPYRYKNGTIDSDMICTYTEGEDACQGDSGGPLNWLSPSDSRVYLIGVVSFGAGCASKNYPNVYMKLTNYLPWISEQTGQQFCQPSN